jgi:hypothetical protein
MMRAPAWTRVTSDQLDALETAWRLGGRDAAVSALVAMNSYQLTPEEFQEVLRRVSRRVHPMHEIIRQHLEQIMKNHFYGTAPDRISVAAGFYAYLEYLRTQRTIMDHHIDASVNAQLSVHVKFWPVDALPDGSTTIMYMVST